MARPGSGHVCTLPQLTGRQCLPCWLSRDRASGVDSPRPSPAARLCQTCGQPARVRYRGASWDARVEGAEALEPGATVYVLAADGNTLKVVKNRPS